MNRQRVWKRPGDEYLLAVDFTDFPMQTGETVIASNARGAMAMTAEDALGADVTSTLLEAVQLVSDSKVGAVIKDGVAAATYWITAVAPSSDGELMTERFPIEVRTHYDG